jgi:hypothetical protein
MYVFQWKPSNVRQFYISSFFDILTTCCLAIFAVLTAVMQRLEVVWDVALCHWVSWRHTRDDLKTRRHLLLRKNNRVICEKRIGKCLEGSSHWPK